MLRVVQANQAAPEAIAATPIQGRGRPCDNPHETTRLLAAGCQTSHHLPHRVLLLPLQ